MASEKSGTAASKRAVPEESSSANPRPEDNSQPAGEILLYREEIALLWHPHPSAQMKADPVQQPQTSTAQALSTAADIVVHTPIDTSTLRETVTPVTPGSDIGRPIDILQLYPNEMNIYGDWGNTLTLVRRLEWMGFVPRVHDLQVGGPLPRRADIVVGGGGQDSGQAKVYQDLLARQRWVQTMVEIGTPMLLVCGMYQLFGRSFDTIGGQQLTGIGVLDVHTKGESERLVGNVAVDTEQFGTVIGFENHSGQTFLGDGVQPLGYVQHGHGAGNNGQDSTEGARVANVVGTYLHGSVLPKNPRLADYLIGAALANRYGMMRVPEVDDPYVEQARAVALTRPR